MRNSQKVSIGPPRARQQSKDIFIVHGHDDAAKHEVARFLEKLNLHPIILHEKADKGRTIIEKLEAHADVVFAVVLLTPDDLGYPTDKPPSEAKPRARQNVVLELGFFLGKMGRARVCALLKGDVELPSDYDGVLYKPMDAKGSWKFELAREIRESGIEVDLNKLT
jgi:predicted nucleotide-binding protein